MQFTSSYPVISGGVLIPETPKNNIHSMGVLDLYNFNRLNCVAQNLKVTDNHNGKEGFHPLNAGPSFHYMLQWRVFITRQRCLICEITIREDSILPCSQHCAWVRTTVVRTNQHPMRNYVIYLVPDSDGQMIHPINCQVFFLSACPFPNRFQGRHPRWFCVADHLLRQVRVCTLKGSGYT